MGTHCPANRDRRDKPGDDQARVGRSFAMRIVVHGQQAFGKAVLEALLKRGDEVIAVYAAPEKPGQKIESPVSVSPLMIGQLIALGPR